MTDEKKVMIKKGEYKAYRMVSGPGEIWITKSLIYRENTGATTFRLGMSEIEPGQSSGIHCHDCEEAMYVLEGKGIFVVDGKEYEVEPGDSLFVKPGEPHGPHRNPGNVTFRYIYVTGPIIRPQVPADCYLPGGEPASVKVEEIE